MKFALLSTLLLGAHAANVKHAAGPEDSQQLGASEPSSISAEAHGSLATQPGLAPTAAPGTAQQHAGNVTALVLQRVKAVDSRVLAYGGGDPVPIFEAARSLVTLVDDLTRVLNGTKTSVPAAPSASSSASAAGGSVPSPITRASFSPSGGESPGAAMRQAIEDLLRDIDDTKWAYQAAGICDIMYFIVGKIGESFTDLLTAAQAQAPAADQAAANKAASGAKQAVAQSQALLGPRYCINAPGKGAQYPGHNASAAHGNNPQLPPSAPWYRVLGSNSTATAASSSSSSPSSPDAAQPTQLDASTASTATPQPTNDRAQGGAAAQSTGSGDATVATAGAAGGFRVPVAAAWGFLLALPGFLL